MMKIENIPTEITYRYSGKYHTVKLSQNTRMYPKHEAAAKRAFSRYISPLLCRYTPLTPPVKLTYTLCVSDKRRRDRSNVLSKVEKYMNDTLVAVGIIPDDCDSIIVSTTYRTEKVQAGQYVNLEIKEVSA